MWVVIEYLCFGNARDPSDRPDEWVHAVHGPFASQNAAEAWANAKPHRAPAGTHQYRRYEAEPLCAP